MTHRHDGSDPRVRVVTGLTRRVTRHDSPRSLVGFIVLDGHRFDVDDARPRLDHSGQQREVLLQGVPFEVAGQVHVAEIGMAVEADAEHLVALALVPVGTGERSGPRVDDGHRIAFRVGHVGLDRDADVAVQVGEPGEHLHAGLPAADTLLDRHVDRFLLDRRILFALAVRRRHPVDGRQEREPGEAGRFQRRTRLGPRVGRDAHEQVVVRDDVEVDQRVADAIAEVVDDAFAEPVAGKRLRRLARVVVRSRVGVTQWGHRPPRSVGAGHARGSAAGRSRCRAWSGRSARRRSTRHAVQRGWPAAS